MFSGPEYISRCSFRLEFPRLQYIRALSVSHSLFEKTESRKLHSNRRYVNADPRSFLDSLRRFVARYYRPCAFITAITQRSACASLKSRWSSFTHDLPSLIWTSDKIVPVPIYASTQGQHYYRLSQNAARGSVIAYITYASELILHFSIY